MARRTEDLAVLRPLGLCADGIPPPAAESLMAGFVLTARTVRAALPASRKPLTGLALSRALPKGTATRGDIVVRLATGAVYLRVSRRKASLVHEGGLLDWMGWPDPESGEVPLALALDRTFSARLATDEFRNAPYRDVLAAIERPTSYDRHRLVALALALIDACGRMRCNDQTVGVRPGTIAHLTILEHSNAA
jgi:hypothetical protein